LQGIELKANEMEISTVLWAQEGWEGLTYNLFCIGVGCNHRTVWNTETLFSNV